MTDDTTVHATIRAGVEQFQKMIKQAALDGETEHSDLYLNIINDEVRILQAAPGESVLTYCSYSDEEGYFDEIEQNREIREQTGTDKAGEEFTYRVGTEAILDVEDTLTYLNFASDGGTVEFHLTGSTDQRLATYLRAEGALEAWVKLPGSRDVLTDVPHWLPFRFNADNEYTNQNGDAAPVQISTKVSKIDKIVEAVEEDRDADFFPIVVEDGEFIVDIGDESRSGVSGALGAKSIAGPDMKNYYYDGFKEIFNVVGGPVNLQTAPGNNPLAIVQSGSDGRVIRHVNGAVEG